jgi:hypothetical protein
MFFVAGVTVNFFAGDVVSCRDMVRKIRVGEKVLKVKG